MKTLFIQTHELASKLSPNRYLCSQLADILEEETGRPQFLKGEHGFDLYDVASLTILALIREQKEECVEVGKLCVKPPYQYRNGLIKVNGFYLSDLIRLSGYKEIRQRLINSLLTRPDRTLCVLIPE